MTQEKDQKPFIDENEIHQLIVENPVNTNTDRTDHINNTKQSNDSVFYDNMIFPS